MCGPPLSLISLISLFLREAGDDISMSGASRFRCVRFLLVFLTYSIYYRTGILNLSFVIFAYFMQVFCPIFLFFTESVQNLHNLHLTYAKVSFFRKTNKCFLVFFPLRWFLINHFFRNKKLILYHSTSCINSYKIYKNGLIFVWITIPVTWEWYIAKGRRRDAGARAVVLSKMTDDGLAAVSVSDM